jgi:hypothetical protein
VVARLGRLRRRIRAVLAVTAATRWVVAVVAAAAAFFLADRLLDLPLGVRRFVRLGLLDRPDGMDVPLWLFLLAACALLAVLATRAARGTAPFFAFAAAGLCGLLLWFAVRALRPLGVPLAEEDLALAMERRFRSLNDRLAAALDFERELRDPRRGESPAMMARVVEEATEEVRGLEVARVVSIRRALRWTLGSAAAVLVAVTATVAMPAALSLWARRSLLAEDVAWPRSTTIVAMDLRGDGTLVPHDPALPFRVSVGRPLVVHAQALGDLPDHVTMVDLGDERRPFRRRMIRVNDRPGVHAVEIRDVRRAFSFVLRGGDDDDDQPLWRVEVTVPPQVRDLRSSLEFPAYLARPAEAVEGGSLTVPEGTRVTVSFVADAGLESARVVLGEETVEARPAEGGRHAFSFEATQAMRYRILLRTKDGRESDPAQDTYDVRVEPDRAPRVEWAWPRGPVEVTPNGRVPLLVKALDDHAVASLSMEVRLAEGEVLAVPLVPVAAAEADEVAPDATAPPDGAPAGAREPVAAVDGPFGRATVRAYLPLEIASLVDAAGRPPSAPARISVRFLAKDSKGQERESPWSPLDVYRPADLERSLAGRRTNVRTDMAAALADQVERRRQVEEVAKGPVDEAERDLLKTVQFAQAKIGQDVDRATRGLLSVVNDFVYDRLGAEGPTGKILAILDRHHRATYGEAAEEDGAGARAGDPVFPYAVYDEVVRGWRDRTIFDTSVLDRMLAVVADAVDAAARLALAAERATAAAAGGEPERIQAALAAQGAVVAALERVLESMRSWQSLNDVILAVRRLTEEQSALNATVEKALERDVGASPRRSPR